MGATNPTNTTGGKSGKGGGGLTNQLPAAAPLGQPQKPMQNQVMPNGPQNAVDMMRARLAAGLPASPSLPPANMPQQQQPQSGNFGGTMPRPSSMQAGQFLGIHPGFNNPSPYPTDFPTHAMPAPAPIPHLQPQPGRTQHLQPLFPQPGMGSGSGNFGFPQPEMSNGSGAIATLPGAQPGLPPAFGDFRGRLGGLSGLGGMYGGGKAGKGGYGGNYGNSLRQLFGSGRF